MKHFRLIGKCVTFSMILGVSDPSLSLWVFALLGVAIGMGWSE